LKKLAPRADLPRTSSGNGLEFQPAATADIDDKERSGRLANRQLQASPKERSRPRRITRAASNGAERRTYPTRRTEVHTGLSLYAGRELLGVLEEHDAECAAYDPAGHLIGVFPSRGAAVDAISTRGKVGSVYAS
jgi:hypothetical protein